MKIPKHIAFYFLGAAVGIGCHHYFYVRSEDITYSWIGRDGEIKHRRYYRGKGIRSVSHSPESPCSTCDDHLPTSTSPH